MAPYLASDFKALQFTVAKAVTDNCVSEGAVPPDDVRT